MEALVMGCASRNAAASASTHALLSKAARGPCRGEPARHKAELLEKKWEALATEGRFNDS